MRGNIISELEKAREAIGKVYSTEQMTNSLEQINEVMQNIYSNIVIDTFHISEQMQRFIEEVKVSNQLSQEDFKNRYSTEIEICKTLGRSGWVISEHLTPKEVKEWYKTLTKGKEYIVEYFDADDGLVLKNICANLSEIYIVQPYQRYYEKGIAYFKSEDYMTSAMYLVALLEVRISVLMKYPANVRRYSQKFSEEGFEKYLQNSFSNKDSFFVKRFFYLNMYPSIIEFLNRTFVDGEYKFETGNEPTYVNRNWLLHGRSAREIKRFECIQLINALSVIEFVFRYEEETNNKEELQV